MLNLRTLILSVVLVLTLMLTIPLVAARTEVTSNPSRGPHSVLEIQEAYANQNIAPVASYRSRLDVCFDVPLSEVSACRAEDQTLTPSYRSRLDECFDVSISEVASCRAASQASTP
jgi:hypothetical protein